VVNNALGALRIHLAEKPGLIGPDVFAFTWITEFPMFEYSKTEERYMATHHPFGLGHKNIRELAGICVDSKEIERTFNRSGAEVEVFYKRKANLFLSNKVVPIRAVPTMYVGAIETAEVFGSRIYAEALSRGLENAQKQVVIGDGAPWIWNIADEQFYGAIQIIDLYHAREHYWSVAREVFGCDKETIKTWTDERRSELNQGNVEQVIEAIKNLLSFTKDGKELLEREIGYFKKNKEQMRYNEFRRQGLFVGSGVIEAGCRAVIGQRLKQSGMHWTVRGANNIIALRCCILSNRWEDFWEYRACG